MRVLLPSPLRRSARRSMRVAGLEVEEARERLGDRHPAHPQQRGHVGGQQDGEDDLAERAAVGLDVVAGEGEHAQDAEGDHGDRAGGGARLGLVGGDLAAGAHVGGDGLGEGVQSLGQAGLPATAGGEDQLAGHHVAGGVVEVLGEGAQHVLGGGGVVPEPGDHQADLALDGRRHRLQRLDESRAQRLAGRQLAGQRPGPLLERLELLDARGRRWGREQQRDADDRGRDEHDRDHPAGQQRDQEAGDSAADEQHPGARVEPGEPADPPGRTG